MRNREPSSERPRDVGRLEAFSDGVFAFAATLLALGIRIPRAADADASRGLAQLIAAEWPSVFAFALGFTTIGIIWANHHAMFAYFDRTDRAIVMLNVAGLAFIAFLPVPTGVLGSWLASERDRFAAVVLYGGTLIFFGLVNLALWWYAAYVGNVTHALARAERRTLTLTWSGGPLLYGAFVALAFVDPRISVAGFVLIHLLYLIPTRRLVAIAQRRRR